MKIFSIVLLCITLSLTSSLTTNAQTLNSQVNEGQTANGIYYRVYEVENFGNTTYVVGDKISVVRKFQFDGIIKPSTTKAYVETINNVTYTGTLTLDSFTFENGKTIALYKGTLTAIN